MNQQSLRIRRATVDDLIKLKTLWASMRLSPDDLEKQLTEFQVVENPGGEVVGAIGIQFSRQHARLHSEAYSDYSIADAARQLFWERIQKLASHNGSFRVWTQERSPLWKSFGFQPPNAEVLRRLPDEWENEFDGGWLTLQLKNEEVIAAALEKEFAPFMTEEKLETRRISEKAKTLNTIITVVGFAIGILGIGTAIYLFLHRNPFSMVR
jgi:N-acetylglutamate synthase-like GNAT family acetyltransferase